MAVLQGPPLFTMEATRNIIYPKSTEKPVETYDRDNSKAENTSTMEGPTTSAADVRGLYDDIGFSNPAAQKALELGLTGVLGPVSGLYTGFRAGLGAIASTMESFEDGIAGDVAGTRSREATRDRAENAGYSREQTAAGARAESNIGGYTGMNPGVGSRGYGLDPGLSEMDPYGGHDLGSDVDSLGNTGYGADDIGVDTDVSGFGDIGSIGSSSRGGYSGSLGDMSSEGGGNDSSGGSSDNDGSGAGGATGGDKDGGRY